MKAIILFIYSRDSARTETLSLTIQDYIDPSYEYLPKRNMDMYEIIDLINNNSNIVPTFNILRIKTNKYYITHSSSEAVKANAYLLTRTDLLLLKVNYLKMTSYLSYCFTKNQ